MPLKIPLSIRLQQIIKPSTIIYVEVLYGLNVNGCNRLLKYIGYIKLPKNKYFKDGISPVFIENRERVAMIDKGGGRGYFDDDKIPLHQMISLSLGKKLNKKIESISILHAITI